MATLPQVPLPAAQIPSILSSPHLKKPKNRKIHTATALHQKNKKPSKTLKNPKNRKTTHMNNSTFPKKINSRNNLPKN